MIIDCAHYQDGRRLDEGAVSLQEAASRCATGGFVWLGLFEPGEDELTEVRDTFGLHELAVEDALNMHSRPKVENYDQNVQLVILRTARYDDDAEEVKFGEISIFLAPTFVITVRQGVASELRGARQRLEQRPELLAVGSAAALWAILDTVVDGYTPVVAGLERDIDQIEDTVFSGAAAPTERIYSLRREVTDFYRAVHPLLAVAGSVERRGGKALRHYLTDVRDHLLLVDEEVAAQRDLLGTILEANMAVISVEQTKISVQQNTSIEQLTILSTVFLPLTFVTGFFGQNFGWLVAHVDTMTAFVIYGIGGLLLPLTLLFLWFRLRASAAKNAAFSGRSLTYVSRTSSRWPALVRFAAFARSAALDTPAPAPGPPPALSPCLVGPLIAGPTRHGEPARTPVLTVRHAARVSRDCESQSATVVLTVRQPHTVLSIGFHGTAADSSKNRIHGGSPSIVPLRTVAASCTASPGIPA